eukprot:jgi/Mesvir1/19180/Mv25583-RA.1
MPLSYRAMGNAKPRLQRNSRPNNITSWQSYSTYKNDREARDPSSGMTPLRLFECRSLWPETSRASHMHVSTRSIKGTVPARIFWRRKIRGTRPYRGKVVHGARTPTGAGHGDVLSGRVEKDSSWNAEKLSES